MTYNPEYPDFAAHEFNHVLQYTRFRPAQHLIPSELNFIEDTFHLRLGEDAVGLLFYLVQQAGCAALDGKPLCRRRWWNLLEVESYIMMTGHERYNPKH